MVQPWLAHATRLQWTLVVAIQTGIWCCLIRIRQQKMSALLTWKVFRHDQLCSEGTIKPRRACNHKREGSALSPLFLKNFG